MVNRIAIAILSFGFVFVLSPVSSSVACDRPGTPWILSSQWSSRTTVELQMQNKSQASEGTLYYEFVVEGRYSENKRIESPRFDQVIRVTLDTNRFDSSLVWQNLNVQMRARRVSNDCVSGWTGKHRTPRNPWY